MPKSKQTGGKKGGRNSDAFNDSFSENKITGLEDIVARLADGMQEMQFSIAKLADTMSKNYTVNKDDQLQTQPVTAEKNNNIDKQYIVIWKELGGSNLSFYPGGKIHPMYFMKKLKTLLEEAEVPLCRRVRLAINCLRGTALEWAENREEGFVDFQTFSEAFKNKFWGIEHEKDLYYEIRYGKYKTGMRAEYFLNLYKQASYLSEKIPENKLIEWLTAHFDDNVRRGVLLNGLRTIDEIEEYLRKYDGTIDRSNANGPNNRSAETRNYRGRAEMSNNNFSNNNERIERGNEGRNYQGRSETNTNNAWRQNESNHTNRNAEVRVITKFNVSQENLLSDSDDEQENRELLSPILKGNIFNEDIDVLIDTGSQISAVAEDYVKKLQLRGFEIPVLPVTNTMVSVAVGASRQRVKEQVLLPFEVNNKLYELSCIVVPKLNKNIIIGCDWLLKYKAVVNFDLQTLKLTDEQESIYLYLEKRDKKLLSINFLSHDVRHQYSDAEFKQAVDSAETFKSNEKKQLQGLLEKYREIFSETPGRTNRYEHIIELHDYSPFYKRSYPIPFAYREEVQRQINEMLDWDIIEPAQTEFVSPLVVVKKKDNSIRICLDARHLNKRMVQDHIVPPVPDELLAKFTKGLYLTTLDMTSSYWQVPIRKQDRKYTGFSYDNGTYVFKVLPFGLSTSVSSFIRGLNKIIGPEFESFVLSFVDDLLVVSPTAEDHFEHLERVFIAFKNANLTLKLRKCVFARTEVSYLGHIVSAEGIRIDPSRITAIQNLPMPRNIRELRGFLGFVNYERRFIQNFSDLTIPLLRLLKKDCKWEWGEKEIQTFNAIKQAYLSVTFVNHPDLNNRFFIQGDSSDYGVGGILFQLDEEGNKKVIAYASRTLRPAELNYTVTEKEALALIFLLQQWRTLILGNPLSVITDHKSLSYVMNCPLKTSRLTRWVLYMQEYNFQISHCKGKENITADHLSRNPLKINKPNQPDQISNVSLSMLQLTEAYKEVKRNLKTIRNDQRSEKWIRDKIDYFENKSQERNIKFEKWYELFDGILFRKGTVVSRGFKLCVPKGQVKALVVQQHQDIGHFGSKKTFNHMRSVFFWPGMYRHIRQIVTSCELCQKAKIAPTTMGSSNVVMCSKPGELVCCDLMGPLPTSRGGLTQLLVVVDAFSRYTRLYALRRASVRAIVNKFNKDYFVNVQIPKGILTDNGTQFRSKLWLSTLAEKGINAKHTSVYFPQGNLTERVNREIGRLIRSFCFDKHTKWACVLKDVEHCINNVTHESTGYTPLYLQFGSIEENNVHKILKFPTNPVETVKPLGVVWHLSKEIQLSKAERRLQKQNERFTPVLFKEGDKVLVKSHPLSSAENAQIKKFFLIYEGPFSILSQVGPNSYLLTDSNGGRLGPHNVRNLKQFREIPEQFP